MESRKFVWHETAIVALGQLIGTGAMMGVFALLGKFHLSVLLGGLVGSVIALANFFAMAVTTSLAADRAAAQDVEGGKKLVRSSYLMRMLALAAALFLSAKSGYVNVVALVLPLVFVRPTITLAVFFRKK